MIISASGSERKVDINPKKKTTNAKKAFDGNSKY
jgi:hypothetical protein